MKVDHTNRARAAVHASSLPAIRISPYESVCICNSRARCRDGAEALCFRRRRENATMGNFVDSAAIAMVDFGQSGATSVKRAALVLLSGPAALPYVHAVAREVP